MSAGWQALVVTLWLVVLLQTALVLILYREVGIVYLGRTSARSRDGLELMTDAPEWEASDYGGVHLRSEDFRGRPLLLVFADPDCRPCQRLMPELKSVADAHPDIPVVVVGADDERANEEMADRYFLDIPIVTQPDSRISRQFNVHVTPFLYVIDAEGRISEKGIVNGRAQIESRLSKLELAREEMRNHA